MFKAVAVALMLVLSSNCGCGAEISLYRFGASAASVFIYGEIVPGDYEKFKSVVSVVPQQKLEFITVYLVSKGGNLVDGLQIGEYIRGAKMKTGVAEDRDCYSVCALIWLAGEVRYIHYNAIVGFHAAYLAKDRSISSSGNALIGAYLSRLGLSYKAIATLTSAPPTDLLYLFDEHAAELGIAVTRVCGSSCVNSLQRQ